MQRRITTRGLIISDGKVYAQRLNSRDGGIKNFWCIPGGGLEEGESLHEGLHREMLEETGVTPNIGKLVFIQQYQENEREFLEFFFLINNVDDYKNVDLEATSHGMIEVAEHGFIDPLKHVLLPVFLKTIDMSNIGSSDVQFFTYLD